MSVQTPFESSANNSYVRIKWKIKEPPYPEELWARVMAVDANARMMHLQPFKDGKPFPLDQCPWVNLQATSFVYVAKQLPPDQIKTPETVDYDEWEKEQKKQNAPS